MVATNGMPVKKSFTILLLLFSVWSGHVYSDDTRPSKMDPLISRLFHLPTAKWARFNLNEMAASEFRGVDPNPMIDPHSCNKWLMRRQVDHGVDFSYGGYLEDRRDLWRGHYLQSDRAVHLGIDFNVPESTEVFCPADSTVEQSWCDPDQNGGWGGRVILRNARGLYLVLAHLDPKSLPKVGTRLRAGDRVGTVGGPGVNGGWFPHLHAQAMKRLSPDFDGYGKADKANPLQFPNPATFIETDY